MRLAKLTVNLCTALIMMTATGNAEDQSQKEQQKSSRQQASQQRDQQGQDASESTLPEFLSRLDLTSQQEQDIEQAMQKHDEKLNEIWSQFHALHWNAVEFEATLAAAQSLAGHDHSAHYDGKSKSKKTSKPTRRQDRADNQSQPPPVETKGEPQDQAADDESNLKIVGLQIAVIEPAGTVRQIRLPGNMHSDDTCEICQGRVAQLDDVWKKMYQLHGQMVRIEADRMIDIESKLTEDQLKKLNEMVAAEQEQNGEQRSEPNPRSASRDNKKERKE